jgi:hypothetical protein
MREEPAMDENDPIHKAIDTGGGQTCDIPGVLRELRAAGLQIVPRDFVAAARHVLERFEQSEAQGYHTKDREFAITMLRKWMPRADEQKAREE